MEPKPPCLVLPLRLRSSDQVPARLAARARAAKRRGRRIAVINSSVLVGDLHLKACEVVDASRCVWRQLAVLGACRIL
jgi:hypothetical protein